MTKTSSRTFRLRPLAAGLAMALATAGVLADEPAEPTGALSAAGVNINDTAFMKKLGLTFGGWIQGGVTYNSHNPENGFNGPVTFADRASEFQLNQFYMYLQKAVATEGDSWDIGGRFDFMFGSDSIFTQAYGVPSYDVNTLNPLQRNHWDLNLLRNKNRFYDIALPQAYLETYIPVGNGLNVKLGHFYTPIGYEVVTSPDNFFYSKPYTFQYGEPFTHTGMLLNYAFDSNWSVIGGLLTGSATGGWDGGWDQQLGNWSGLMGGTWTSDDKDTSFNITGTYGGTSEHSSKPWALYSMVLKHNWTDKLHMVLQHDHGFANGVYTASSTDPKNAEWYGVNSYLFYDIQDNLAAGIRAEWFRDNAGFRVCTPQRIAAATNAGPDGVPYSTAGNLANVSCSAASWYAVTAGVTYKPVKWLTLRPNVRYDWADGTNLDGTTYKPFGNSNKQDQFLFSADAVVTF